MAETDRGLPTTTSNLTSIPALTTTTQTTTTATTTTLPTRSAGDSPPSPTTIILRAPRKHNIPPPPSFRAPPLEWLQRTWTVTHSTLPMWRKAKNVRITYTILPPAKEGDVARLDDEVQSEPVERTWMPQPKSIRGVDTPDGAPAEAAWKWRGNGLLKVASSRWEVLGWGEDPTTAAAGAGGEAWVVTWFAESLFTPAGVDVYSSRREGISPGLYERIEGALKALEAKEVAELCANEMREVRID